VAAGGAGEAAQVILLAVLHVSPCPTPFQHFPHSLVFSSVQTFHRDSAELGLTFVRCYVQ
jgi:hypothetical protein